MQIKSLGYQTDLIFARFSGEIIDKGEYTVIRTPSNPTFWYGNFLVFPNPPKTQDVTRWMEISKLEFRDAKHCVIGFDSVHGEMGAAREFETLGFAVIETVVMTASEIHAPPKVNTEAAYRPILTTEDWEQAVQLRIECNDDHEPEGYKIYVKRKMLEYQRMTEAGLGNWWGAFLDGKMVSSLGLFLEHGVGRFQSVETHANYRRQGLCGTLVYTAAKHALEHHKPNVLVMCADPEYHAAKIYESVGFKPTETQMALERLPQEDQEFRVSSLES
jgi:N-acetylglutamate synthase-like GNAT family acetyltransferase